MTSRLHVFVPGNAHPQGSKRHVGGGRMIEASPHLKAWRATVVAHVAGELGHHAGRDSWHAPEGGPVRLTVVFHFPRPKHHYRSGKLAHLLRPVAPQLMQVGPDLDKLVRAIGDALTISGAIVDDRQIHYICAAKKWTTEHPYTSITLET